MTCRRRSEYNASMELDGKVVVVTGASMGIGEAIAKCLPKQARASSCFRGTLPVPKPPAPASVIRIEPSLSPATSATRRRSTASSALTLHHFKRVDVWINNAGHGLLDSVAQVDMSRLPRLVRDEFLRRRLGHAGGHSGHAQQGGGAIINISSVAGHIPLPFHAAYSATKFALNAIGKAAGVELKKDGIHVLTVCPGYVQTAFQENAIRGNEMSTVRPASVRGITAERVARATLQGYLKQKREVIVPWTMHVPVKLYQLFPALVERMMGRMAK